QAYLVSYCPSIGFYLLFTCSTSGSCTTTLSLKVCPHPCQPREQVLIPGQFHLRSCLRRLSSLKENIEDQQTSIIYLASQLFLKVAELRWAKIIIKDDHIHLVRLDKLSNFLQFTFPYECADIGLGKF